MKKNGNVIEMVSENKEKKDGKFKRKAMKIGEIVAGSVAVTLDDKDMWTTAMGIGTVRGLYKWNAKSGLVTGAVVMGAAVGINVVGNLARNIDKIYKA